MIEDKRRQWYSCLRNVSMAVILLVVAIGCTPSGDTQPVDEEIRSVLDSLDAKTAFYAKHLPSGREIAIRADEPVNTLSLSLIHISEPTRRS